MARSEPPAWDSARLADPHRQPDKSDRVRAMFDAIAPTYELVNRVASAGFDARWRREMVRRAGVRPDDGTGDVCRAFASAAVRPRHIVGVDFSGGMLARARGRTGGRRVTFCQGDALALPFADGSFTLATCAFGVRNFQELGAGLSEMRRVLRRGGRAVILEFGMPTAPVLQGLYRAYFTHVMPLAARAIARDGTGAYRYLPRSVVSFCDREGIVRCLNSAGFAQVDVTCLTLGIVTLYCAFL
jgi:demethylmenaquinone methyltransferase/2-methoxy-6-polyprenyl-1,4-benzoquinol methylase